MNLRCGGYCRGSGWGPLGSCFPLLTPGIVSSDFESAHTGSGETHSLRLRGRLCSGESFVPHHYKFCWKKLFPPFLNHRRWYQGRVPSLPDDWGDSIKHGKKNKVWDLIQIKYNRAVCPALFLCAAITCVCDYTGDRRCIGPWLLNWCNAWVCNKTLNLWHQSRMKPLIVSGVILPAVSKFLCSTPAILQCLLLQMGLNQRNLRWNHGLLIQLWGSIWLFLVGLTGDDFLVPASLFQHGTKLNCTSYQNSCWRWLTDSRWWWEERRGLFCLGKVKGYPGPAAKLWYLQ